jgi:uncharacterized protein Yka (UPF0111/DUF47 family)
MPPPDDSVSLGELSRRLTDVFTRFEGLARRLEDGQFVTTALYLQYKETVNQALAAVERAVEQMDKDKVEKSAILPLENRVAQLEDDKKWLTRLVLGFIVLGVLAVYIAASGGSTG